MKARQKKERTILYFCRMLKGLASMERSIKDLFFKLKISHPYGQAIAL